jgi:hypothetical protein
MSPLFGDGSDDHGLPRKVAILSIASGTFLVIVMLIFLGVLANQMKNYFGPSFAEASPLGHDKYMGTLSFIRNHWVLLVGVTVGFGTALVLVARATRRPWMVYGLGIASPLAYISLTIFLVWLVVVSLLSKVQTFGPVD